MLGLLRLSIALLLTSLAAQAATLQATITGTVTASYDMTGMFGLGAASSLDGYSFGLTYTYDTSLGTYKKFPGTQFLTGGSDDGTTSPVSAVLTINGVSQSILGLSYGSVWQRDGAIPQFASLASYYAKDETYDPITTRLQQNVVSVDIYDLLNTPRYAFPGDITAPFSVSSIFVPGQILGYFGFLDIDGNFNYALNTKGNLVPTSLVVSVIDPAPVPLPASALLLLAGVAAIPMVRRRRRAG
jgi:hypothetical protein